MIPLQVTKQSGFVLAFNKEGYVKYSELKRLLRRYGAHFKAHLGSHDLWELNGIPVLVPRHDNQEVPTGTLCGILKKLCITVNK